MKYNVPILCSRLERKTVMNGWIIKGGMSGNDKLYRILFYEELLIKYLISIGMIGSSHEFKQIWLTEAGLGEYCKQWGKRYRLIKCNEITLDLGQVSENEMLKVNISHKGVRYSLIEYAGCSIEYKKAQGIKNKYLLSGYDNNLVIIGGNIIELVQGDKLNLTKYHIGVINDGHNHVYNNNYLSGSLKFISRIHFYSKRKENLDLVGVKDIQSSIINQNKDCQCVNFGDVYTISNCRLYGGWYNINYVHRLDLNYVNNSVLRVETVDMLLIGFWNNSILEIDKVLISFDIEYAENIVVILHSDMSERTFRLIRHSLSVLVDGAAIVVRASGENKHFNPIFLDLAKSCRKAAIYVTDYWKDDLASFGNVTTYDEEDFEYIIRHEAGLWK